MVDYLRQLDEEIKEKGSNNADGLIALRKAVNSKLRKMERPEPVENTNQRRMRHYRRKEYEYGVE